jgi:putative acetyltransferase
MDAIAALVDSAFVPAFNSREESTLVRRLAADGDSVLSLVAHDETRLIGHAQFFRIQIDGAPLATGLGPMCAAPDVQKSGIGSGLIKMGLMALEGAGETICFVLGHPDYYPRFGFDHELTKSFAAPWTHKAFMARRLAGGGPTSGTLTYPAAFG